MARPDQDSIDTFMSITGVSETIAIRMLEECGGNLNEAVNAHFSEGVRNPSPEETVTATPYDFMDVDDPSPLQPPRPANSYLQSNPLSLLDVGSIYGTSSRAPQTPYISHPMELREIPVEDKGGNSGSLHSSGAPTIEDVIETPQEHGPEVHGTVILDDDDNDGSGLRGAVSTAVSTASVAPSAPTVVDVSDYNDDIEEEMIRAAIEASKKDAVMLNQFGNDSNVEDSVLQGKHTVPDDVELAQAVSLSLQNAGRGKTIKEEERNVAEPSYVNNNPTFPAGMGKLPNGRHSRVDSGSTSLQGEAEDLDDLPLVRRRRRHLSSSRARALINIDDVEDTSPPSSPEQQHNGHSTESRERSFHTNEWGGISSQERDEAIMLEAAMFGGIPETGGYSFPVHGSTVYAPRPMSPSLAAQRFIREQQDDEYLASLQADQEKELKAKEEAEAALAEERNKEAELSRKLQEEQENERLLAMKEDSLPQEPATDDENAVTLLVRMPDGSRRGRRFLKSDKLQCVFNFIDVGRVIKPGSYRLVRSYPRRAFGNEDGASSLDELGLNCKQEALYLEVI